MRLCFLICVYLRPSAVEKVSLIKSELLLPRKRDPLPFRQLFGEVGVVEVPIALRRKPQPPPAEPLLQLVGGSSLPLPVDQAGQTLLLHLSLQPFRLAVAHLQAKRLK